MSKNEYPSGQSEACLSGPMSPAVSLLGYWRQNTECTLSPLCHTPLPNTLHTPGHFPSASSHSPVPFPVLISLPPPLAQISAPKGPISGHVPSPLEAHPCIWLLPTEEGADYQKHSDSPRG